MYGLETDTTTVSPWARSSWPATTSPKTRSTLHQVRCSDGKENNAEAHAKYEELSLEEAASVKGVPYHPGAAKYYEEQGITVESAEI